MKPNKKRIFIWVGNPKGGFEKRNLDFVDYLDKNFNNFDITIGLFKKDDNIKYKQVIVPKLFPDKLSAFSNFYVYFYISFIMKNIFDIYYTFMFKKKGFNITRVAGDLSVWYKSENNLLFKGVKYLVYKIHGGLIRRLDLVICTSRSSVDYCRRLKIPDERIVKSSEFVDDKIYHPIKIIRKEEKKKFRLLFIGRDHDAQKNYKNLIKACLDILDLELYLAGIKKRDYQNIRFLGWLTPNKINEEINKSDALICPSYYETFGITPIESLISKKPTIISDKVECKYLIKDYVYVCRTGYLSIKKTIMDLMNEHRIARQKAVNGHNYIMENLIKKNVLDKEINGWICKYYRNIYIY